MQGTPLLELAESEGDGYALESEANSKEGGSFQVSS